MKSAKKGRKFVGNKGTTLAGESERTDLTEEVYLLEGYKGEEITMLHDWKPPGKAEIKKGEQLIKWELPRALNLRRKVVSTLDWPIWSKCSIVPFYPFRPNFQSLLSRERWGQG